jgi:hypothetical protein
MLSLTVSDLWLTSSIISYFILEITGEEESLIGTLSYERSLGNSSPRPLCYSLKKLITDSLSFFKFLVERWIFFGLYPLGSS